MKSYHDKLIYLFCQNLSLFELHFGFKIKKSSTGIYFPPKGEIDIIIEGFQKEKALVEVKSNNGLISKFLEKQFHYYRLFDPNASIHLLLGTKNKSVNPENWFLKRYWPIN